MKECLAIPLAAVACLAAAAHAGDRHVLANRFLSRTLSTEGGTLRTVEIANKLSGVTTTPGPSPEFRLRFSQGTDRPETQFTLAAADLQVTKVAASDGVLSVALTNAARGIGVGVRYELAPDDVFLRKRLTVTSASPVTLERIDVEALALPDAFQPYTTRDITASAAGRWSPGLGQPLYATNGATFWGVEFPAADNRVADGLLTAGYLRGLLLKPGEPYASHPAVMGVADDPAFVADAFLEYIDRVRARPLRLQVQYNSWFDFGGGVRKETFTGSVARIHRELVAGRGVPPLNVYVIDDGWQDAGADWSDKVWKVNAKFDPDFATSRRAAADAGARLGLWMSPGCLFGARPQIAKMRAAGLEAIGDWSMSMAGPRYMQSLEDRMVELARQGVAFFKLDGLFGHLNTRNFELDGGRYGLPTMPQLGLDGLTGIDKALNDARYDELKIYYLSAGAERLMRLFAAVARANPDIYLVISNGAWLSPWWLMHADAVWMINAGDAAGGSTRTQELVYRDDRYHEIWREQNAQFPMCSIFNHEPKKTSTGESKDEFRRYLYMNLARGTGFIELYIKPSVLQPGDWDVLAEGLRWARAVFPTFRRVRMFGGSPRAGEVYGYTAWGATQGYVALHNPSGTAASTTVTLDRASGLVPGSGPFHVSSPIDDATRGLPATVAAGDALTLELRPREIRVIDFTARPADWSALRELQTRSPETGKPRAPPVPVAGHAILGAWEYPHGGQTYTRTFAADGTCTLRRGDHVEWTKPFEVDGPRRVRVEGSLVHELVPDGTLRIEGRYTAARRPAGGTAP